MPTHACQGFIQWDNRSILASEYKCLKRSVGESLEIQRQETASVGQGSNNKDIGRYVKTNTYDFQSSVNVCLT